MGIALTLAAGPLAGASLDSGRPSALLPGATVQSARDLAVRSAQERGWSLIGLSPAGAAFEQVLAVSEDDGGVAEVIRVFAELAPESGGVRVHLRAEELEAPGTEGEWMTDVTARYADNLAKALAALRAKWDARAGVPGAFASAPAPAISGATGAPLPGPGGPRVGTWAYYAEAYAQSLGCALTDAGATLVAAGQGVEQHRVPCEDGRELSVRCADGECASVE